MRLAIAVFAGAPFALIGGVLALYLRGLPFSIPAAVGFIAVAGVAVLNGVVMASEAARRLASGRGVVIGGIFSSTLLGLAVMPVLLWLLAGRRGSDDTDD